MAAMEQALDAAEVSAITRLNRGAVENAASAEQDGGAAKLTVDIKPKKDVAKEVIIQHLNTNYFLALLESEDADPEEKKDSDLMPNGGLIQRILNFTMRQLGRLQLIF